MNFMRFFDFGFKQSSVLTKKGRDKGDRILFKHDELAPFVAPFLRLLTLPLAWDLVI